MCTQKVSSGLLPQYTTTPSYAAHKTPTQTSSTANYHDSADERAYFACEGLDSEGPSGMAEGGCTEKKALASSTMMRSLALTLLC